MPIRMLLEASRILSLGSTPFFLCSFRMQFPHDKLRLHKIPPTDLGCHVACTPVLDTSSSLQAARETLAPLKIRPPTLYSSIASATSPHV